MDLSSYIDHTLLKPDCTLSDVDQLCQEAKQYGFASVCIPPYFVAHAANALQDQPVRVSTVIGFPMGYASTPSKVEEIKRAIDEGAEEIDAVVNLCAVKSGQWNYVKNDIDSMTTAAHLKGKKIKIILETSLLQEEEIRQLVEACLKSEVDYLKTSTGINGKASLEAVRLLRELAGGKAKIKASGGIRNRWDAEQYVQAGADRIGSSSGVAIVS
jgi:deoxyribose-phosphate aldolase